MFPSFSRENESSFLLRVTHGLSFALNKCRTTREGGESIFKKAALPEVLNEA